MAGDLFDTLVEGLIGREGGYVNDPADPGGETIWGVTKAVARENGFAGRMVDMTRDEARAIYRAKYWAKPGLYLVAPLSPKIAEELLDTGVNMGTGTAGMFLQTALNAFNRDGADYADVVVDGAIGPGTAKALQAFLVQNAPNGERRMLKALNCQQGVRYLGLRERFVNGWFDNRVEI